MGRWLFCAPLFWLLAVAFSASAFAEKRVALVVGNSAYRNVPRLDNPANDAKLLADTLSSLGFTLVGGSALFDLDKPSLDQAVQALGAELAGADVGLFYYAGHGVQIRGENYLIPVDANPTKEADVDFQMLDTNLVLRQMEGAGTRLNIVILDACRNNPFGGRNLAVGRARDAENSRMRDTSGGLAQMQAPEGTLISFATQPGGVAQDGSNGNSPYARALALTMRRPNLDIFQTFNQVGLAVKRATGGVQQPWVSSSPIDGTFYFGAPPVAVASGTPLPASTADQQSKPTTPAGASSASAPPPQDWTRIGSLTPSSASSDIGRFDGFWVTTIVCEKTGDVLGWTRKFIAKVKDGVFHGQFGAEGQPGSDSYDGTIELDGSIELVSAGLTGRNPKTLLHHSPPGVMLSWRAVGRFEATHGSAIRVQGRPCNIDFAKR